jgi:hypothetical protein
VEHLELLQAVVVVLVEAVVVKVIMVALQVKAQQVADLAVALDKF